MWLSPDNFPDQQIKRKSIISTEEQDGWPYSFTTGEISAGNNFDSETLMDYDLEETLGIKEEITAGMTIFLIKIS